MPLYKFHIQHCRPVEGKLPNNHHRGNRCLSMSFTVNGGKRMRTNMPKTRKVTEVPLIGNATPDICGNQLPSKKQVLQCYFHYRKHFTPKLSPRQDKMRVIRKCAIFWNYAGIPMIKESNAIDNFDKLLKKYDTLIKYGSRTTGPVETKTEKFKSDLENLFDIAHQTQVNEMKNEDAKTLLRLHRQEGRNGRLDAIIDSGKWVPDTPKQVEGEETGVLKQVPPGEITMNYANYIHDDDEDIEELLKQIDDDEETDGTYEVKLPSTKPKKLKIMTPNLTAVLDRAKVSDRSAARLIAATLHVAGITLDDVFLSHQTVGRHRQKNGVLLKDEVRDDAKRRKPRVMGVHWDGKQQSAQEDRLKKVDRLSVLVSGHEWHQLLGVPRLDRGTGEAQAEAVYDLLQEWGFADNVCAMTFDTTASNTGNITGACLGIEKLLEKDLLYLACRHHILELLLKAAFVEAMGCTSGPDVLFFKRFQGQWPTLNKTDFSPGIEDATVEKALRHDIKDTLAFAELQLKNGTVRMDYKEFLELVVIFLGGKLMKGNRFRALIDIHHARWMSKAIYSLKMFLFRKQLKATPTEKDGLKHICIFIVLAYQRAWFTASDAVTAPNNDFNLLKKLAANASSSSCVSVKVWNAAFNKFVTHLWYLSEELIGLAFFDENVSMNCKRKMCQAIKSSPALKDDRKKRKTGMTDLTLIQQSTLDSFVTKNTMKFFKILGIDTSFLESDPTTWEERDDFCEAFKIVKSLHVTNDIAERSVALVSEYNSLLTKDEKSKQNLLLLVQKFRELSPGCNREDLQLRLYDYLSNQSIETPTNVD